jgi:hypothetical protein
LAKVNESKEDPDDLIKKKTVNNLYGVDFDRLLEAIKKDGSSNTSKSVELAQTGEVAGELMAQKQQENEKIKFENSLRAFKINKRLKTERLNKSAILKLSQLEFEELKRDSNQKDDDEEDGFSFDR